VLVPRLNLHMCIPLSIRAQIAFVWLDILKFWTAAGKYLLIHEYGATLLELNPTSYPDESCSLVVEEFKDGLVPLSMSSDIISCDVSISDVGLSVAMVQIKLNNVGYCSRAHLGRIPANLCINVLFDQLCSDCLSFQSKQSLFHSSYLLELLICFE